MDCGVPGRVVGDGEAILFAKNPGDKENTANRGELGHRTGTQGQNVRIGTLGKNLRETVFPYGPIHPG